MLQNGQTKKTIALTYLIFTLSVTAQDGVPTFKSETRSAIVWDDTLSNSAASTVHDPLTGNELHKLSHAGIEVSSRLGYERVSPNRADRLLVYITTIANNTRSDVSIRYGGANVDGRIVVPLQTGPSNKQRNQHTRQGAWELNKMHCFKTGFAFGEVFFSDQKSPQSFAVHPGHSVTVSFVTKDPRSVSILCSMDGCHLTGTVRYYVSVDQRDFVFVWSAHSAANCGE